MKEVNEMITEDIAALLSALKAAPSKGPWKVKNTQNHGAAVSGPIDVSLAWCGCATTVGADGSYSISAEEAAANAGWIAAANPERVARILEALLQAKA